MTYQSELIGDSDFVSVLSRSVANEEAEDARGQHQQRRGPGPRDPHGVRQLEDLAPVPHADRDRHDAASDRLGTTSRAQKGKARHGIASQFNEHTRRAGSCLSNAVDMEGRHERREPTDSQAGEEERITGRRDGERNKRKHNTAR